VQYGRGSCCNCIIGEGCRCTLGVESRCHDRGLEGSEVGRKEVIGGIVQLEEGGHVKVLGKG
jgi:hypothetical protein